MATVGQRPRQFNPISKGRDNTDDLEAEQARVAARIRRKSIPEFSGFRDPATSQYSVPPMTPRQTSESTTGGGNGNGGSGDGD